MFEYLKQIRAKPERERKRILLASSVGLTLVIAFIWFFQFRTTSVIAEDTTKNADSPFRLIGTQISSMLGDIGTGVQVLKKTVTK